MWFVIILIVVLVLGKFLWDRRRMELSIKRRGGMRVVYAELITLLLSQHPRSKIFHDKASYLSLGVADAFSVTLFELVAAFNSVIVVYKFKSKYLGNHRLEWTFQDSDDQEFMLFKIERDINSYLERELPLK